MPQEFARLAERIVEAILEANPGLASSVGDHRFDDRLPDLSPDGVFARTAMLRDASQALSEVDAEVLDPEDRIDHAALLAVVERGLFELTEVREHEWNPIRHNPGPLLHGLIARPFAPVADRLESLAGRLAAIPDALAIARGVLRDCPHIHFETAAGQFAGAAALVRGELPPLLAEAPSLASMVEPAAETAVKALDDFAGWLRDRAGAAGADRDPRLGRRLWEARLWHTLDTELSAAEVLSRARANLDRVTEDLREAAAALVGGPATDETVRVALDRLGQEHPDNSSIVDLAKVTLDETTAFVREHDLVSLVDDPCVIEEMPEFARGIAVGYCDAPGPLETADVPTFYCIAPTPADWPPERVDSFYREYNNHMVRNLTVHEAMPGHFLQLAHGRRFRGSSRARALAHSGPFVEGWAVYAEELMVSHGFGGLPIKLQQLKMQLRMSLNAILDQLVHCEDLSEADAMALMTGRGFQEEGEAAGKWRRALLTSTQLSTYFVGYVEVAEAARARPAGTPERVWHDAMLAHGSPAPRHLRVLLSTPTR
jgi:phage tail protein X